MAARPSPRSRVLAWVFVGIACCAHGLSARQKPDTLTPNGYVNDYAGVLDDAVEEDLRTLLRALEKDTTAEVAVATISSLDGLTVEEYAEQLFRAWGIGQRKVDNGVLVLVAPSERKVRIEVAYGLEPVIPDGLAGQIIRTDFLPKFRESDYTGGVRDGVTHLASLIRARHVLTDAERQALKENEATAGEWIMVPFLALFVAVGGLSIGVGLRARAIGAALFGFLFSAIPGLLSMMFLDVWGRIALAVVAAVTVFLGLRLGAKPTWRSMARGSARGRRGNSDGWVVGNTSGSDSSSSSSGGSDSFGGGSSGGGGASGSW